MTMLDTFQIVLIIFIVALFVFVVGIGIAGTAHTNFKNTCSKYSHIVNSLNMTGYEFVVQCLIRLKQNTKVLYHKNIDEGDCYVPSNDQIILNQKTFFGKSIVDLAIASHEMGHSIQKHKSSLMLLITSLLQKLNGLLGGLFFPLLLIGGVVYLVPFEYNYVGKIFMIIGFISFILGLLLKIFLIPLEYNASKRAQKFIKKNVDVSKKEFRIIKKVHKVALLTYVASLFEKPYIIYRKLFGR